MSNSASFQPITSPSTAPASLQDRTPSLAVLWARRHVRSVSALPNSPMGPGFPGSGASALAESTPQALRQQTSQKVMAHLPTVSGQAFLRTHQFLDETVRQQHISPAHLDLLQIATDNRQLFQMVLEVFAAGHGPDRLSAQGSRVFGQVRQRYTQQDGRVLGFVALHVHYTILGLLAELTLPEQACFEPYLKVMNDHLYMPLWASYQAAASHEPDSTALQAVQALLPRSSEIAQWVFFEVGKRFPKYRSYSGSLTERLIQESSIRDVEMFQIYLCLCLLEGSIRSVTQELFPLCVMLYPRLGVSWELVRTMIRGIAIHMPRLIPRSTIAPFTPYLKVMVDIFSPEVFQDLP